MSEDSILEDWFDAIIRESTRHRFNYPPPMRLDLISSDEPDVLGFARRVSKPCVEITLPPHQYERLQQILEFAKKDFNHTMVPMTSSMYRVAEQVMMEKTWESEMRKQNPMLQSLWDQYQTALTLCR